MLASNKLCLLPHTVQPDQTTVYIRVVFLKLGEIETVKETFAADVFIQAGWREPALDGKVNMVGHHNRSASVYCISYRPVHFRLNQANLEKELNSGIFYHLVKAVKI